MMLGNGTTRKYQFDNRGQLTTQIEFSGATPVCTIVDGYDPVGNRLTRNLDGNPITWSYDDLYRLTGQQKAGQVCTYTLDGVGNLKTMWEGGNFPRTFTFNAADRLVTMVEGASLTTYAWTGYGALESEITGNSTTGYSYNGQDQLAVVTAPTGDKTTYSFEGDGLRRSVATTNVSQDPPTLDVTTMVWDGSDYLLLNEPTQNRVVLTLDSEIVACGSKDLLTDPLGSLVKEISSGASLGGLVQMTPYGTLLPTSGKVSIPFVYIAAYGYYNDSTDRDYVRARELYKKLGRWMQTDPIWPYQKAIGYCDASPTNILDPTGMWWIWIKNCKAGDKQRIIDAFNKTLYNAIDALAQCVEESGCPPATAPDCLRDHKNNMPPSKPSFTVYCDYNCSKNLCGKGSKGPPPSVTLCMPQPKGCGPLACVIAHELIHMCGIRGTGNNAAAFLCVGSSIPGCEGFRGGHGLDIE